MIIPFATQTVSSEIYRGGKWVVRVDDRSDFVLVQPALLATLADRIEGLAVRLVCDEDSSMNEPAPQIVICLYGDRIANFSPFIKNVLRGRTTFSFGEADKELLALFR